MTLAALVIVATLPLGGDYGPVVNHLRDAARAAGCANPVVEMNRRPDQPMEILVRCREAAPDKE